MTERGSTPFESPVTIADGHGWFDSPLFTISNFIALKDEAVNSLLCNTSNRYSRLHSYIANRNTKPRVSCEFWLSCYRSDCGNNRSKILDA